MTNKVTPMKTLLAGLAFTVAGAFNAYAHVPAEGSEQHNLLKPFQDFIMQTKNNSGGSCCNLDDGRGNLEERMTKDGKYQVKLTHDLAGAKLATPRWIDIPESAILTAKHAKKVCDEVKSETCKAPPFNVLWANAYDTVYCYYPRPNIMN
jgi:hypothetical protein